MFWFNGFLGTMDARENEVVLTNALVYIWKRLRDDRSVPMSNELVLSAESCHKQLLTIYHFNQHKD